MFAWVGSIFHGIASTLVGVFAIIGIGGSTSVATETTPIPVAVEIQQPTSMPPIVVHDQSSSTQLEITQLQKELDQEKAARLKLESQISSNKNKVTTDPPVTPNNGSSNFIPSGVVIGGPGDQISPQPSVADPASTTITVVVADDIINIKSYYALDIDKTRLFLLDDSGKSLLVSSLSPKGSVVPNYTGGFYFYVWNPATPISALPVTATGGYLPVAAYKIQVVPTIGAGPQTSPAFTKVPSTVTFSSI